MRSSQRVEPAVAGEAGEAAVACRNGRAVLDRERCEVRIGHRVRACIRFAHHAPEDAPMVRARRNREARRLGDEAVDGSRLVHQVAQRCVAGEVDARPHASLAERHRRVALPRPPRTP